VKNSRSPAKFRHGGAYRDDAHFRMTGATISPASTYGGVPRLAAIGIRFA
jgi:hypothetical protein